VSIGEERVRRINGDEPRARKRLLPMRAKRLGAYLQFEPQDIGRAERSERIQKAGVRARLADRSPEEVGSARPFAQRPIERPQNAVRFVGRLERRIDEDNSATLPRRQIGIEGDIAVRADDAEPSVAPERGDERLALVGIGFAERDPVLGPHEGLGDRRRPRIGDRPAFGIVRTDGLKIGAQELPDRRRRPRRQDARDPLAPFRRAPRLVAR
jgi:hypothetical protein